MCTFESDRKEFEVNPLINSEPVEILNVMRDVRTKTKVKDCSKSKVLNTLELCKIGRRNAKEERIALIKFRGDNRMNKSRSSINSQKFPDRSCIFQEEETVFET